MLFFSNPLRSLTWGVAALAASGLSVLSAQTVYWDGGAGRPFWEEPTNWSGDVLPSKDDTVYFNTPNELAGGWRMHLEQQVAKDLVIDLPQWALRPTVPKAGRPAPGAQVSSLRLTGGQMRFTSLFTNVEEKTFSNAVGNKRLRLMFESDGGIRNEGSGRVVFSGEDANSFGIGTGRGISASVWLAGSGDFIWENGTVFGGVRSFGTASDFTGVFEITGGLFRMEKELRCAGGTTRVRADEVFYPEIDLVLDGQDSGLLPVLDISGATDTVHLLRAEGQGGRLIVDAQTNYTFEDYGGGSIAIEGFVEGKTRLQFNTSLVGRPLTGLSINGSPVGVTTE